MEDFRIGDAILTDYGSARVAAIREDEDEAGQVEVGFLVDGEMAWASADYVRKL